MGGLRILWKGTEALIASGQGAVEAGDADGEYLRFEPKSGSNLTAYLMDVEAVSGGGSARIIIEFHEDPIFFPVIVMADNFGAPITAPGLFLITLTGEWDGSADSGKNGFPYVTRIAFQERTTTLPITFTGTIYAVTA